MSASESTDRRTITELRRMDRETARAELTVPEYDYRIVSKARNRHATSGPTPTRRRWT